MAPVRADREPPRVLIVDDDEDIRETLRMVLELEGYAVSTATNGQQALAVVETLPELHLVLLDLMMPVMDGWTFARRLRTHERRANVPIVVLSAFADRAEEIDAIDVLPKPIDMEPFIEVVHRVCGKPS